MQASWSSVGVILLSALKIGAAEKQFFYLMNDFLNIHLVMYNELQPLEMKSEVATSVGAIVIAGCVQKFFDFLVNLYIA